MKRLYLLITISVVTFSLSAQRASRLDHSFHRPMDQALRIKFYGGYIPPLSYFGTIDHSVALGGEFSYEFFTNNSRDWAVHWRQPVIGIALQAMDLGNSNELGQMVALFPYIRWDLARTKPFIFSMRLGMGVAGVTRLNHTNGSYFGFVGNADIEFQFNLNNDDWLTIEPGMDIFSNCGFSSTEFPTPLPYLAIGYMHRFTPYQYLTTNESLHPYTRPLPDHYAVNISADAGAMNDWTMVRVALHADYLTRATNCWLTGVGLDGDYHKQLGNDTTTSISQRIRCGLSWSNRLTMNRFHFIADFGLYLYDPERPKEYFYRYNPIHDHSWNYFRLGAGVRVIDNLYLQLVVHTNGFRAEYTSFGLSYSISRPSQSRITRK